MEKYELIVMFSLGFLSGLFFAHAVLDNKIRDIRQRIDDLIREDDKAK